MPSWLFNPHPVLLFSALKVLGATCNLRSCTIMLEITSSLSEPSLKAHYNHLRGKGKKKKKTSLLSLDGSGFFSWVSVFFSLLLSKLVTSSRLGLSDMVAECLSGDKITKKKKKFKLIYFFPPFLKNHLNLLTNDLSIKPSLCVVHMVSFCPVRVTALTTLENKTAPFLNGVCKTPEKKKKKEFTLRIMRARTEMHAKKI